VGICAGAYYGAGRSNCGIRLIDVDVFDIEHWNRGQTDSCKVKYTPDSKNVLGEKWPMPAAGIKMRYVNGPMLEVGKDATSVLNFESDLRGSS